MKNNIKIENCLGVYPGGPETIALAEIALQQNRRIYLDVGTGNGYIAIFLKKQGREVDAVDISSKAIKCAQGNAILNNCRLNIFQSDLFKNIKKKYDCITFIPPINAAETEAQRIAKSLLRNLKWLVVLIRPILYLLTRKNRLKLVNRFISEAKNYLNFDGQILISLPVCDISYINRQDIDYRAIFQPTKHVSIYQIKFK